MTTKCGGGASTAKAGVNTSIYVDQRYIQSLLPPALAWLYPYLPFMDGLAIGDVASFCGTDPPNVPSVPTALEFLAFVTGGNFGSVLNVNQFLVALTKAYLWDKLCECGPGVTPTPTTPPSDPGDLPPINPPIIAPPSAGACLVSESPRYFPTAFNDYANMLPPGPLETGGGTGNRYAPLPSGATSFLAHWDTGPANGSGKRYNITLAFWDAALAFHGVQSVTNRASGSSGTFSGTLLSTYLYYNITVSTPDSSPYPAGADVGCDMTVWCNGAVAGSPAVPCCPPDPVLMGLINRLTAMVELIQRQAVPFGYVSGTVHSGLTDDGSLTVADLIGVSVDITTLPASYGSAAGTPPELFDLGYVTMGSADGWTKSRRIDHDATLWLPPAAGAFTSVGYSLSPGVVATITELVREP